uniref:Glutathione S-transferase n=1 Tax=Rhabditophanes sp. KR3021 TaxID=114890 RepID=A0AC35UH90_9BILA
MGPSNLSPMELALSQPHILSQCADTIPIKLELAKTCIRYYNGINDLKVCHIQGLKYNPVDIEFYIYKKKLAFKMLEEKPMEKLSQFKSMIQSTKPHNWKEHLLVKVNIACEMHKVSIYKSIKTMLEMIPKIAKFKYITLELLYERGSCVDIEPTKHKDFFVPIVEIMSVLKSNSVKEFIVKSGDIYQLAFLVSKLIRNKEFLTNTYPYIRKLKLCLLANDGRYRFANGVVDNETFDFFIKKVLPQKMYYMEERKKLLQTMDPNVDGQIWDKHEHLVLMELISKLNLDILHFEFNMSEYTYYPVAIQYTQIYQKREKNLKISFKPFNDEATMSTANYKLIYSQSYARGEPIRLAFVYAGVKFEDFRTTPEIWEKIKHEQPFKQMPVLEVDGVKVAQSAAIALYVGEKFGLSGNSALEKAHVLQFSLGVEDILADFKQVYIIKDEAEKAIKQKEFFAVNVAAFLNNYDNFYAKNGGLYLVGKSVTTADLLLFHWAWIFTNKFGVDLAPYKELKKAFDSLSNNPKIKSYLASRPAADI